jgi:hypothetical protein
MNLSIHPAQQFTAQRRVFIRAAAQSFDAGLQRAKRAAQFVHHVRQQLVPRCFKPCSRAVSELSPHQQRELFRLRLGQRR